MAEFFLFIVGLVLLVRGADFLVYGGARLASRFGISELIVGLTVVALGTSLPELSVSLTAAIRGSADLALGNAVGSNIANLLLILGISSIVYPLAIKRRTTLIEFPFSLLAAITLWILANDQFFIKSPQNILSRLDGFIFLIFASAFVFYLYKSFKSRSDDLPEIPTNHEINVWEAGAKIFGGALLLIFGGQMVVGEASAIAAALGVSQTFIGIFIIALGTSLPELATSVLAAYKKNADIAVGNIIGSNIINIFLVIGISAIARPLEYHGQLNFDLAVLILSTTLIIGAILSGKNHKFERSFGVVFILAYLAYLAYSVYKI
ncbi:MAG: calcium/sodium antiporter [Patescibacteria group bacterium]